MTQTQGWEESFEGFWRAYPKKRKKGDAEKAFRKINPSPALLQKMLSAIEDAKKTWDWKKEKGQYIPYPATWLRAKCWEDELPSQDPYPCGADKRFSPATKPTASDSEQIKKCVETMKELLEQKPKPKPREKSAPPPMPPFIQPTPEELEAHKLRLEAHKQALLNGET